MKMMMRLALAMTSLLLFAGCTSVYSPEPLGDEVVSLDPAEWQGTWFGGEMIVMTTVVDAGKGLLQAAWMERKGDGARFEVTVGQIRSTDGVLYASIEDDEKEGKKLYHWSRIDKDKDQLTLWLPRPEEFETLIKQGVLPGVVTEDGVVLEKLTAEHLEMLNDVSKNLLDWQEPVVFYRLASSRNPAGN